MRHGFISPCSLSTKRTSNVWPTFVERTLKDIDPSPSISDDKSGSLRKVKLSSSYLLQLPQRMQYIPSAGALVHDKSVGFLLFSLPSGVEMVITFAARSSKMMNGDFMVRRVLGIGVPASFGIVKESAESMSVSRSYG